MIELIAKDKKEKLQFVGKCKLRIDAVSKLLLIEPENEEFKMISAMFNWKFVVQKNILFVFAEHDFQDFALIFTEVRQCERLLNVLLEKEATSGNQEQIKERFLPALFDEIAKNNESSSKLKELFFDWIEKLDGKEKEGIIQILKDRNIYDFVFPHEDDNNQRLLRKRKRHCPSKSDPKTINAPNFELISNEFDKPSKLIVFPSDRSQCYEYTWNKDTKLYNCLGCRKLSRGVSAQVRQNSHENSYVKLLSTNHACEIRKYNPEKFIFDKSKRIIDSSNFHVFKYSQKGVPKSALLLFCPSNKNLCYEFYLWGRNNEEKKYFCGGCKRLNNCVSGVIYKKDGKEYFKLSRAEHICDLREVDLTKFIDDVLIQKPMFEIIERIVVGIKKKFLLLFTSETKEFCYKFACVPSEDVFNCQKCRYQKCTIRASLKENQNGDEIIYVGNKKHICIPQKYSTVIKNNIVLPPSFVLLKRKVDGKFVQHLCVFINAEKTECFEYTWAAAFNKYVCNKCRPFKVNVYARLHKSEDGNGEYVELSQAEHKCPPRKFVPEAIIKYVYEPDFKLDEYTLGKIRRKRLLIFDKTDKNFCYILYYSLKNGLYLCSQCHMRHKYVTAKLHHDDATNQNFVELSETEHVCELQRHNILTVRKPNFKLDECTIDGFKRKFIIIFDQNDSSFCYKYCYFGTDKSYLCVNCRKLDALVTARLKKDADGEEFVALNKNFHVCSPVKYNSAEFSKRILTSSYFKVKNTVKNGVEKKQLLVDSTTTNKYFIYVYSAKDDAYFCKGCNDKNVSAKLKKNSNDEDYLEMGEKKHLKGEKCRAFSKV